MELLLSLTIISVLGALVMTNYHDAGRQSDLRIAARQLATHIRDMQNKALSGQKIECAANDLCAWGIHLTSDTSADMHRLYRLFEDYDNINAVRNDGEEYGEPINLPPNVIISQLRMDNGGGYGVETNSHITFQPPDPTVTIARNQAQTDFERVEITLSIENTGASKIIEINKFGLVDVD